MVKSIERKLILKGGVEVNISELSRLLDCSWQTAKKIAQGDVIQKQVKVKPSLLDDYKQIIIEKRDKHCCTAKSIYKFIVKLGYKGSYELVKKFVKEHCKQENQKAVLRVTTQPGLQAQVDWKEEMKLITKTGEVLEFNIFLYILSHSRYKYFELTTNRKQTTLFKCLINAFKYCDTRIPDEIWFDNMKTVVTSHDLKQGEVIFNPDFKEFAKQVGFNPIACKPYRPQTKGKAENLAKLMDRLKVYNEEIETLDDIKEIVKNLNKELNEEVCQATEKTPNELFEKEKEYLTPITNNSILEEYESVITRIVSCDSTIVYNKHKYSVPTNFINKEVIIEIDKKDLDNYLSIYYNKKIIACHKITEKLYNYEKEHLIGVMKSDVYKYKSNEEIEKLALERLKDYDRFGGKYE